MCASGLDPDDTDDEEEDEEGDGKRRNVLEDLNKRFDDEKDALFNRLRGKDRKIEI